MIINIIQLSVLRAQGGQINVLFPFLLPWSGHGRRGQDSGSRGRDDAGKAETGGRSHVTGGLAAGQHWDVRVLPKTPGE